MRQILQKLLAKTFIGLQQFYFFLLFAGPGFHIFPHFINAFFGQNVFVIRFFPFSGLGLVDKLINEFYFSINKTFQHKRDQEIAADKNNREADKCNDPVFFYIPKK